jgi:hypothetical protein
MSTNSIIQASSVASKLYSLKNNGSLDRILNVNFFKKKRLVSRIGIFTRKKVAKRSDLFRLFSAAAIGSYEVTNDTCNE